MCDAMCVWTATLVNCLVDHDRAAFGEGSHHDLSDVNHMLVLADMRKLLGECACSLL
jgi:hypothetical protein